MNRTLLMGITLFLAFVGFSLVGGEREAAAGRGYRGCFGVAYGCHGCDGYQAAVYRVHHTHGRSFPHRARPRGFHACHGGYASAICTGRYGSCVGCVGYRSFPTCCGSVVVVEETTVVPYHEVRPVPIEPAPSPAIDDTSMRDRAILNVRVPAAARVFENGREKIGAGSARRYVAVGLEPGKHYRYEVRAELIRDHQKLSQTKVILVEAGQNVDLVFNFDSDAPLWSRSPRVAARKN